MSKRSGLLIGLGEFVSPKGRLNRLPYFANAAAVNIISFAISFIFMGLMSWAIEAETAVSLVVQMIWVALVIFLNYVWFCLVAKRLHDMGLTAWIGLIIWADTTFLLITMTMEIVGQPLSLYADTDLIQTVITIVRVIFSLIILFTPGQKGENRFGKSPNYYLQPQKPHVLEG